LGKAIVAYAKEQSIALRDCTHFYSETGRGIEAEVDGKKLLLGNNAWLVDQGIVVDGLLTAASDFAEQGKTPVFMALNGKAAAVFGIADKPRPQAIEAIQHLKKLRAYRR